MAFLKVASFLGLIAVAFADVNEIVGNNQYLPPKQGYNYDRPSPAFPSSPAARPTPSYRPPAPSSPSYSPTPSYQAPSPTPSYRPPAPPSRPVVPRPSAPGPVYNPNTAPSGPTGVIATGGDHHDDHHHHEPGMPYDFEYKVKDDYYGTDYSRNEVSDGDVIRGEYRVQLPDGRLQIVKYTADWKNGFNADVSYQGEPTYPAVGAGSSGSGNIAPYPSSGSSNSYAPPPSNAPRPSASYGPPSNSGY